MKITNALVHQSYEIGKRVYAGELSQQDGIIVLQQSGMKESSAYHYLRAYICMMRGEFYSKTINIYATKYYLGKILSDNGKKGLARALEAVRQHLDYQEAHNNLKSIKELYHEYLKMV
jgi:hypothetical protein